MTYRVQGLLVDVKLHQSSCKRGLRPVLMSNERLVLLRNARLVLLHNGRPVLNMQFVSIDLHW